MEFSLAAAFDSAGEGKRQGTSIRQEEISEMALTQTSQIQFKQRGTKNARGYYYYYYDAEEEGKVMEHVSLPPQHYVVN